MPKKPKLLPRIAVKIQYGLNNSTALSLPGETPRKEVRRELKRQFKNIHVAEVEFPNGDNATYLYEDKKAKKEEVTPENFGSVKKDRENPSMLEQEYAEEVAAGNHRGFET